MLLLPHTHVQNGLIPRATGSCSLSFEDAPTVLRMPRVESCRKVRRISEGMVEVTEELQSYEILLAPRICRTCDLKYVRVSLDQEIYLTE